MENTNPKVRRGGPVKLIWLLVTIGMCLGCIGSLSSLAKGRQMGGLLENALYNTSMYLLPAVGAGLCMARGCINLSLPGTMSLSMLTFGIAFRSGMAALPAALLAVLSGAAYGALNGLFAIQRGRNIQLVTALSSLLIGMAGTGFAAVISNLRNIRLDIGNRNNMTVTIVLIAIGAFICFLGAIGGKKLFRLNTDEQTEISGGNRFLWSVIAGMLAALAGIFQAIRNQQLHVNIGSDYPHQVALFFILVAAGILIPNVRRTYGEALFGLLSIVFAAFVYTLLNVICLQIKVEASVIYIVYAVFGLLLMIPNLLICRKKKENAVPKEDRKQ